MFSVVFKTMFYCISDFCMKLIGIKSTWYILHCFFNLNITYLCFPYVLSTIYNVYNSLTCDDNVINTNNILIVNVMSFHLYHLIIYIRSISISDILHHLTVIFYYVYLNKYAVGKILSLFIFSLIGPAGFINYLLLVLHSMNVISKSSSIRYTKYVNMYFRMPLCLFACSCGLLCLVKLKFTLFEYIFNFIIISTVFYNGIYYTENSIKYDILKNK